MARIRASSTPIRVLVACDRLAPGTPPDTPRSWLVGTASAGYHVRRVRHDIHHDLPLDVALKVARKAVDAYGVRFSEYSFDHAWRDDARVNLSFSVAGKRLDGSLEVHRDRLSFELDVPFVFRIFRGKALDILEREARVWIEKGRSGELA